MTYKKSFGAVGESTGLSGTSVVNQIEEDQAHLLNHLIRLGLDLVGAYDIGIGRLRTEEHATELKTMQSVHARQTEDLAELVAGLGHIPASHRDLHGLFEEARVGLASLLEDQAILETLWKYEAELFEAYEEAAARPGWPSDVQTHLATFLAEGRNHRATYDRALGRFVG